MVPLRRAPSEAATSWGPYYDALHPPGTVHMMTAWKLVRGWMAYAEMLWQQREELRRSYEENHGSDPELWPVRHPGVLLGAKAACLGCHWLHYGGRYLDDGGYEQHWKLARRHEESDGEFRPRSRAAD